MLPTHPDEFAHEWIAGWNAAEGARVPKRYTDDVTLTSPMDARVVPEGGGLITIGHAAHLDP